MTFEEILHSMEELGIEADAVIDIRHDSYVKSGDYNVHYVRFGIGPSPVALLFNSDLNIFRFYAGDDFLSWPNEIAWSHCETVGEDVSCAIVFDDDFKRFLPERTCGHVEDSGKVVDLIKRMIK